MLRSFLFLITCTVPVLAFATDLTPASIAVDIDKRGPKAVVGDLDAQHQLDDIFDKMSGGDKDWVALAPKLAPGMDAGAAEGLSIVLAQALTVSPAAVLAVADPMPLKPLSITTICSVPFIEPTPEDLKVYFSKTIPAVTAVNDTTLQDRKNACLASLKPISDRVNSMPTQQ